MTSGLGRARAYAHVQGSTGCRGSPRQAPGVRILTRKVKRGAQTGISQNTARPMTPAECMQYGVPFGSSWYVKYSR
jgi:hypothetical protein